MYSTSAIRLFPNPAQDQLTVHLDEEPGDYVLQLSSMTGEIVREEQLMQKDQTISLSGLATGTYFYFVRKKNELMAVGKIVIDN